jgi:hypothetical protein
MRPLLAAALLAILAPLAAAQSTLPPAGHFSIGVSLSTLSAGERFDHEGAVVPFDARLADEAGSAYSARTIRLLAEYGLLEHVAVSLSLPLVTVTVLDPAGDAVVERANTDLGAARIGVRMGLAERIGLPREVRLAAGLALNLPLGYARNVVPAVGAGQVDSDLFASAGYHHGALPAYAEATFGFRHRTNLFGLSRNAPCDPGPIPDEGARCFDGGSPLAFSDEVFGRLEAGYLLIDRFSVRVVGDLAWSVERPEAPAAIGGVIQPERFAQHRIVRLGGGLDARMVGTSTIGIEVMTPVYGRNAPDAAHVSIRLHTGF